MIETVSEACSYFTFFSVDIRDFTAIKTTIVVLLPEYGASNFSRKCADESKEPQQLGRATSEIASIALRLLLPFCALRLIFIVYSPSRSLHARDS